MVLSAVVPSAPPFPEIRYADSSRHWARSWPVPDRIQFQRNELHFSEKLASWGRRESRYQKNFRMTGRPEQDSDLHTMAKSSQHSKASSTNVTRSYAGKGAVRYAW
jgi:hypothetical protein